MPEPIEITLNYEDGTTEPTTIQTDENGKLATLPTPTREGYEFVGWFDAQAGGNQITTETVFAEATAIYAQWKEAHTHNFEWKIDKEATETEDGIKHEECACGEKRSENTVIPKTGTAEPDGLSTDAIVAIVIACVVVLAGGGFALYWFVFKKKQNQ